MTVAGDYLFSLELKIILLTS